MIEAINKAKSHPASQHETKFVINNSAVHLIIQWLRCRCVGDRQFPAGIVSSIYYDTRDWRFLREKINSDYLKTKVRLRWYADIDSEEPEDESYLEAKYKVGSRREKVRIRTDFSGKWLSRVSLDNKKLLGIPDLLRSKGVMVGAALCPAFKITYKRLRFLEPTTGARLSVDYDIRAADVNRQMLPRANPFVLRSAVFELKGPMRELPDVLGQLTALGCRKQSFSKYSACYARIMRITF
jgi:hypothetical protein